ncbi:carbonic anhydrase [Pseudomonas syringae]|uniref:carbonic anhydrase n=1 Tax=Pseudomonas syringae TaxID=317 RepID=UPI001F1A1F08|nr:carbonic anhydrase [Pseudomonas syringae]MCF5503734.1 carbonic anhydrase [Pseudomonas syringae]
MNSSLSRRKILQCACCLPVAAALMEFPSIANAAAPTSPRTTLTADQALKALRDGNDAFMTDKVIKVESDRDRRLEIAKGQTPFCILISCSDSRVPPELLFGRGLGELFIVRNAGNTVDTAALGSIEYGVSQLGVPLVVVMGHEKCGAVAAAVSVVEDNTVYPGAIGQMIEPILPAVLTAKSRKGARLLDDSVKANVQSSVARLRTESKPTLMNPSKEGQIKIGGSDYSLAIGKVDAVSV